ncbi:hypothetical protein AMTR_s00081p00107370 [Amborella trichopoda]|uniref:Uncharacterized protein n=1 Tax=Amborella trichopoda TaxID=13333 RepID=W1P996_AMBTC|nr:hypothetical protein AMTR_s00081p00107370 [Amborella trichopoda]
MHYTKMKISVRMRRRLCLVKSLKDVEEGDIRETPTQSKASEKGKSIPSAASRQTKRNKRAVADTLKSIVEIVADLGPAVANFKNSLNPHIDEVCETIFHINGVADDVDSRACMRSLRCPHEQDLPQDE